MVFVVHTDFSDPLWTAFVSLERLTFPTSLRFCPVQGYDLGELYRLQSRVLEVYR